MRVLRIYHAGRVPSQRKREMALVEAGVDLTLVVPAAWPDSDGKQISLESSSTAGLKTLTLPVARAGDVNRHRYSGSREIGTLIREVSPDLIDIHEEPFSVATHQWIDQIGKSLPVTMYTAQNIDKRFPPPFSRYESRALKTASAIYPCSQQAAAVVRGKGFGGLIDVIPLGYDSGVFVPGDQSLDAAEIRLGLVGRLVPEKGVVAAAEILRRLNQERPARLFLIGDGREVPRALAYAASLGVGDRLEHVSWQESTGLATILKTLHFVLVPSLATTTWVEQFGRVIVEGQASGAVVAGYSSGAIPEAGGEAAILVPEGRRDVLAEAMASTLRDPARWHELRRIGLLQSESRSWRIVGERHADFYERALSATRTRMPSSPRARRARARVEFGSTASTSVGTRPFALPWLRQSRRVSHALGMLVDVANELLSAALAVSKSRQ